MLTVSKAVLPAFLSLVITSFSSSPAFGVASSDCPFVKPGTEVSKLYSESFKEVAIANCDRTLVSQEQGGQLLNPAAEAIRQAYLGMVFEPPNPLRVRVARVRQGESRNVFSVWSAANDIILVKQIEPLE